MTGKVRRKAKLPTHYIVNGYGGLGEDSIILLEQIRTIDKRRLKKYIGQIRPEDMEKSKSVSCSEGELESFVLHMQHEAFFGLIGNALR